MNQKDTNRLCWILLSLVLKYPNVTLCVRGRGRSASVAQSDVRTSSDQEVAGSIPTGFGNIFSWIDHEIFSAVILPFPLIQEVQLSVSGERMCTSTG